MIIHESFHAHEMTIDRHFEPMNAGEALGERINIRSLHSMTRRTKA